MRVLFVSSEIYPLAKSGGLADVSAALPMALAVLGVDVQLLMPGYPGAIEAAANKSVRFELEDFMGAGTLRLISARTPDTALPIWLVDCPALFERPGGPYLDQYGEDWPDNALRFALFNHVAARVSRGQLVRNCRADVVHANDWHAGLLPVLIPAVDGKKPGTIFTMHNLAYQGLFPADLYPQLSLPKEAFGPDGLEFYGKISFLKAGIRYADRLTTVSPSYAREILTSEYGCGLEGLLQARRRDLTGILNGVDHRIWDPATDSHLSRNYTARDIGGKHTCKAALQAELHLESAPEVPLVIYMSRMTDQKMADVVLEALPSILERDVQFALLGEGDSSLEDRFQDAGCRYAGRVAIRIGYEEALAHRFQAGADILLHPSRFEPCGLTQLYAMRYGTVPVVRRIGGLADTIVDANDRTVRSDAATGFAFEQATVADMTECLDRSLELYRQPLAWRKLQRQVMRQDFGWDRSARQYLKLYERVAPDAPLEAELDEDTQTMEMRA